MRKLILGILPLFFVVSIMAQDKVGDMIALAEVPESMALVAQAKIYAEAVTKNNYTTIAELTHGDVVEMGGGADFIISDLKAEGEQLIQQGFSYTKVDVGNHPEFLSSGDEIQTIIPIKYYLRYNDKDVEAWSNLFASSTDQGVTWKFVNLDKFDEGSLREFVKNVSPELIYPNR